MRSVTKAVLTVFFCWSLLLAQTQMVRVVRRAGGGTVATPTDSPGQGTYSSSQTVTLSDSTSGATICYTTDGSTPGAATPGTCDGAPNITYSAPFAVDATTTIKAIGTKAAMTNSGVLTSVYTINSAINYGNVSGSNGSDSTGNSDILYGLKVTMGSNAAGYSVTSATIITGTFTGTAHYRFGIWATSNYTAAVCQTTSSTNVLASASTNTLTSLATDCAGVTLAANTEYYIGVDNDLAAAAYATYTSGSSVWYDSTTNANFVVNPWTALSLTNAAEYPKMYLTVTPK